MVRRIDQCDRQIRQSQWAVWVSVCELEADVLAGRTHSAVDHRSSKILLTGPLGVHIGYKTPTAIRLVSVGVLVSEIPISLKPVLQRRRFDQSLSKVPRHSEGLHQDGFPG